MLQAADQHERPQVERLTVGTCNIRREWKDITTTKIKSIERLCEWKSASLCFKFMLIFLLLFTSQFAWAIYVKIFRRKKNNNIKTGAQFNLLRVRRSINNLEFYTRSLRHFIAYNYQNGLTHIHCKQLQLKNGYSDLVKKAYLYQKASPGLCTLPTRLCHVSFGRLRHCCVDTFSRHTTSHQTWCDSCQSRLFPGSWSQRGWSFWRNCHGS